MIIVLKQLGSDWIEKCAHQTRFQEPILQKLRPDWSAYSKGPDVYISNKKTAGAALAKTVCLQVIEDDAEKRVEVGLMFWSYTLQQQIPFSGSFNSRCLSEPLPKTFHTFLDVLLGG